MLEGMIERLEQRARNMGEMMRRLGVVPGAAASLDIGRSLEAAARSCSACRSVGECTAWLSRETGPIKVGPSFCPNRARFREISRTL